jgi:hypothetical protein
MYGIPGTFGTFDRARMLGHQMSDAERLVFTGEAVDGTELRVEWYPNVDAEVLYVSTRPSHFARWSPPTECTRDDS